MLNKVKDIINGEIVMTKDEFLKHIQEEKPDTGGYGFFVDDIEIIPGGPEYYRCRKNKV